MATANYGYTPTGTTLRVSPDAPGMGLPGLPGGGEDLSGLFMELARRKMAEHQQDRDYELEVRRRALLPRGVSGTLPGRTMDPSYAHGRAAMEHSQDRDSELRARALEEAPPKTLNYMWGSGGFYQDDPSKLPLALRPKSGSVQVGAPMDSAADDMAADEKRADDERQRRLALMGPETRSF